MKSFIDARDYVDDVMVSISSNETPLERAVKAAGVNKARLITTSAPIVRIIGAKGQHIFIQHASHVEVFGDGGNRVDYSCAYSTYPGTRRGSGCAYSG
ncbi:hypothetical protein [Pseudomonas sp. NPDC090592]|uniref:hypothetical protein n=1 Tax=Pseudomonas sp. NPDC090592 TaxID=3364480 RepID=UPI00383A0D51